MSALVAMLREEWDALATRWPNVHCDPDTLAARLEALEIESLDGVRWVEFALAQACVDGDAAALRVFEAEFIRGTERALQRLDSGSDFVDEAQQRLRERLLVPRDDGSPRIADYRGRGPLAGWVSVAAVRVGLSLLRASKRAARRDEGLWAEAVLFPTGVETDLQHLKQRYAPLLAECIRKVFAGLEERERAVLRMYFVEGLNIDAIGLVYGVHRSTIARWISRTRSTISDAVHAMMVQDGVVPSEELQSIDRLVRSQLDISLGGLLG